MSSEKYRRAIAHAAALERGRPDRERQSLADYYRRSDDDDDECSRPGCRNSARVAVTFPGSSGWVCLDCAVDLGDRDG